MRGKQKIVMKFLELLGSERNSDAFDLLAPNARWWTPSATLSPSELAASQLAAERFLSTPIKMTAGMMTAEEDRVAVEACSYAELKNGRVYQNTYHFLFYTKRFGLPVNRLVRSPMM
jgi:uncharacterized protein